MKDGEKKRQSTTISDCHCGCWMCTTNGCKGCKSDNALCPIDTIRAIERDVL